MVVLWIILIALWVFGAGALFHRMFGVESLGWADTLKALICVVLWPILLLAHGFVGLFMENRW